MKIWVAFDKIKNKSWVHFLCKKYLLIIVVFQLKKNIKKELNRVTFLLYLLANEYDFVENNKF